MTEGTPRMAPEELQQLGRSLMAKVIDKAASDERWKQRLLDDPEAAVQDAGFPESQQRAVPGQPEPAALLGEMLESMGGAPGAHRQGLQERALAFARRLEEGAAFRQALDLARGDRAPGGERDERVSGHPTRLRGVPAVAARAYRGTGAR